MDIGKAYEVQAEIGGKLHTLTVETSVSGGNLQLAADVPVLGAVTAQGLISADGEFAVEGAERVLLKRIDYRIEGRIDGDALAAVAATSMGEFDICGKRIG